MAISAAAKNPPITTKSMTKAMFARTLFTKPSPSWPSPVPAVADIR